MIISERLKSQILAREATERDLDGASPAEVRAVKSDPNNAQFRMKASVPVVDEERRVAKFIWTDESVDGDGDKFLTDGWKLNRYKSNPVILWSHDRRGLPIGVATSVKVDKANKQGVVEIQFATDDEYEFAGTVFKLVKAGMLKATSAGFRVLKIAQLTEEQVASEGLGRWGIKGLEQELHEISLCTVPSNANALQLELKALVERGEIRSETAGQFDRLTERDMEARRIALSKTFEPVESAADLVGALTGLTNAVTKNIETTRSLLQHVSDLTKGYALIAGGQRPDAGSGGVPEYGKVFERSLRSKD